MIVQARPETVFGTKTMEAPKMEENKAQEH